MTLQVTDSKGVMSTIVSHSVIVPVPIAAFSSNCAGLACTFNASGSTDPGGTIGSYAWTFGDGATDTGVTPAVHTYSTGGTTR